MAATIRTARLPQFMNPNATLFRLERDHSIQERDPFPKNVQTRHNPPVFPLVQIFHISLQLFWLQHSSHVWRF